MRKSESGFTLIELLSVIIIIGILAIIALPRFSDLNEESHQAAYEGAFASFKSAVNVYHSAWVASGQNNAVSNLSTYGNGTIDSTSSGYPGGTSFSGTLSGSNCNELWENLIDSSLTTRASLSGTFDGVNDPPIKYWFGGNPSDATAYCYYIYVGYINAPGALLPTLRYYPNTGQLEQLDVAYAP